MPVIPKLESVSQEEKRLRKLVAERDKLVAELTMELRECKMNLGAALKKLAGLEGGK